MKQEIVAFLSGGTALWLFSTAVRTMPKPHPLERWYGWLYRFCQKAAANHDLK